MQQSLQSTFSYINYSHVTKPAWSVKSINALAEAQYQPGLMLLLSPLTTWDQVSTVMDHHLLSDKPSQYGM